MNGVNSSVQNLITNNSMNPEKLTKNVLEISKDQDFITLMEDLLNSTKTQVHQILQGEESKKTDISQGSEVEDEKMIFTVPEMLFNASTTAQLINLPDPLEASEIDLDRGYGSADKQCVLPTMGSKCAQRDLKTERGQLDNQVGLQKILSYSVDVVEKQGQEIIVNDDSFLHRKEEIFDKNISKFLVRQESLVYDGLQEKVSISKMPSRVYAVVKEFDNQEGLTNINTQSVQSGLKTEEGEMFNQVGEERNVEPRQVIQNGMKLPCEGINDQKTVPVMIEPNQVVAEKILAHVTDALEKQGQEFKENDTLVSHKKDKLFDDKISETAVRQESLLRGEVQEKVRVAEIPSKVQAVIKEAVDDKSSRTIELKLDPEHLGNLKVRINWSNSKLTAQFYTQNDGAAKVLENEMVMLKQNLNNMNIDVAGLSVSVSGQTLGSFGTKSQQLPQYKRYKTKLSDVSSVERLEQNLNIRNYGNTSVNYLV